MSLHIFTAGVLILIGCSLHKKRIVIPKRGALFEEERTCGGGEGEHIVTIVRKIFNTCTRA